VTETQPQQPTPEEAFRASLEDVVVVLKKLATFCRTPEEVVDLCELALISDGQLKLLMVTVLGTDDAKRQKLVNR